MVPGAMKGCKRGVRGMESVAVKGVGEDFAEQQATEKVFEYSPGHRKGGGDFQCAADMEDLGEEVLDSCLEQHA